jgi:hypothetical protein
MPFWKLKKLSSRQLRTTLPQLRSAGDRALQLARACHNIYERLAPDFGYKTRTETRDFNPETPNGKLMVAVCREILNTHDHVKGSAD